MLKIATEFKMSDCEHIEQQNTKKQQEEDDKIHSEREWIKEEFVCNLALWERKKKKRKDGKKKFLSREKRSLYQQWKRRKKNREKDESCVANKSVRTKIYCPLMWLLYDVFYIY